GNPWFFNEVKQFIKDGTHRTPPDISERVAVTKEHIDMSIKWKGEILGLNEMKRHYSNYFRGIPNFKPFRTKLVTSMDLQEVYDTLGEVEEKFLAGFFHE
ncbi:MAG: tRNA-dihydrouridine synthase B, partial [Arenicella sp.]